MKKQKNNIKDGPSAEDKALERFSEMMIERIEEVSKDWNKPWLTDGLGWPRNLAGREYGIRNAFMLSLHCEREGYRIPCFCTFDTVRRLNDGDDGQPRVSVLKGETAFPVFLAVFIHIHKETGEKITQERWDGLSDGDRENYHTFPRTKVFSVFNIAQTNLQETRPQLWEKIEMEYSKIEPKPLDEMLSFAPMDEMIEQKKWLCPITTKRQDDAYYSIMRDEIVVPEKSQFKDGESFYCTLWHEMVHSTGAKNRLNRLEGGKYGFGTEEYAREELVAELGSAMLAMRYGLCKHLNEDSSAYLKYWLEKLKEDPKYIKTVLDDMNKAASMVMDAVDATARFDSNYVENLRLNQ